VQVGLFTVLLQFDESHFKGEQRWLEIVVDDTALFPLQELTAMPYTLFSLDTERIRGRTVGETSPTNGQVLKWDAGQDQWLPGNDAGEAYTAGDGITLTSGEIALDLVFTDARYVDEGQAGCIGTAMLQDGAVHTVKIAADAVTDAKIADVAWAKITGAPAEFPPGGPAGGDLAGTYPDPAIAGGAVTTDKIADTAVTDAKIADVAWAKITGAPSSFPPTGAAGGDLDGQYPDPTVAKVQGRAVSTAAPGSNQVLKWDGSAWAPAADNNTMYTAGAGLNLSGTQFYVGAGDGIDTTTSQVKVDVSDFAGWGLIDDGANNLRVNTGPGLEVSGDAVQLTSEYRNGNVYDSRFINEGQAAGGDLANMYPNPLVAKLRGRTVSSADPADNDVLKWNDTANQWEPDDDSLELPYSASINTSSDVFSITNTRTSSDAAAVYAKHDVTDQYGIGLKAVAGYIGVDATVTPTTASSSPQYYGVWSRCNGGAGGNFGVMAEASSSGAPYGVHGYAQGLSNTYSAHGVHGYADGTGTGKKYGVHGEAYGSGNKYGVYAESSGSSGTKYGVYGKATGTGTNWSGYFEGNAKVTGNLTVSGSVSKGSGSFKIDHPLDPENQYLYHSFVESPDMLNVYNGNVVLDDNGIAVVVLPDWFEVLNRDFRYQLTCIGGFAPVYIAEEIQQDRFKIAGGTPGLKVSWQVTGVRQDPFAEANRIPVEQDKPEGERGTYLHPTAYGVSEEYGADYQPPEDRTARPRPGTEKPDSLTTEQEEL